MRLPEICIRHPVFASVLSIAIMLLGILSFQKLAIQYFPEHQTANATVNASITGASAEFMSRNVADKLIDAAAGLDSIDVMTTDCVEGRCTLKINFNDDVGDIEYTNLMNKLRSSVEAISDFPPSMTDKPTVTDNSSDVSTPSNIITFTNTGGLEQQEMYDYINQQLIPQFRYMQGVGGVFGPYGGSSKAVRIWLKPERMKSLGIKTSDVVSILSTYNSTFTAGAIKGEARDFSINPVSQVTSLADVQDLVIRVDNSQVIRIKDIADVVMGEESLTPSRLKVNGNQAMSIQILPLKTENPVVVAEQVKLAVALMQEKLPEGIEMKMVYDQAEFVESAINEGFATLFEAVVLVSVVVMLFLGSFRVASVPITTIPVCVIGVFSAMVLLGFSINVLTILAIILAIGLVVDDAIVVVENCYRHIEQGETPFNAALKGSREIVFPVIAMTLTLAVVYLPIGLMSGLTADLFRQFAFTLAAAVIISGIVALTLSPMMSAYLIRPVSQHPRWFTRVDRQLNRLANSYTRELEKWIDRKAIMAGISCLLLLVSGFVVMNMPQVLLPTEDSGFIEVSATAPTGVGRQYHLAHNDELNSVMVGERSIEANLSYIEGQPKNHVLLKSWGEREQTADEVVASLNSKAKRMVSAYDMSFVVRSADNLGIAKNLILELTTVDRDIDSLALTAEQVTKLLENYSGVTNVKNSTLRDQLTYDLNIDRNAIALSGVNYKEVTEALSTYIGSVKAADLQADDGFTYPIKVQVNLQDLGSFNVLDKLYVSSNSGQSLPLSQFVSINQTTAESNFKTYMGKDSAEITADLMPGYNASDVRKFVEQEVPSLLNNAQGYTFNGAVKLLEDSQDGTQVLFLLALIFVYLILAAQFESFIDPFIIMLTVPLCIIGALLTLSVFNQSLNIYSMIGLLTLVGLVTKHGILLVEFANEQHRKGRSATQAALDSARSRLRPILMTSLTMILGALPLAFASGPGSLGRINIGLVLVGGLVSGTFFSLFIVPVAYVAMVKLKKKDILANWRNSRKIAVD